MKSNAAKEIKFARSKIKMHNSPSVNIESLFNQIIETIFKLEPFVVKLQSSLMLDKNTAMVLITEYWKFVLIAIKEPTRAFPSHYVELAWKTHIEFTDSYRSFCHIFFGEFKKLSTLTKDNESKNKTLYSFTKAEYERLFLQKPDVTIWEDEELRFNKKYISKVYVNLNKIWLTKWLKMKDPNFLCIPYDDNLNSNKVSSDTIGYGVTHKLISSAIIASRYLILI